VFLAKYYLGDQIEKNEMIWSCSTHVGGERRGVHGVFVGNPEGNRLLGRTRHRWKYNIKIDLQEVDHRLD
jgi:hypothetical protein